jgi:hypothetical protein
MEFHEDCVPREEWKQDWNEKHAALNEVRRLQGILVSIIEISRDLTNYCRWCGCRPDQTHREECPAYIAYIGVMG